MTKKIATSVTKTLDIAAEPKKVFDFIANPLNWPKYAIVNLISVEKGKGDSYEIVSKQGKGQVRMMACEEFGILDHTWEDTQASWRVYVRIFPNFEGTTLTNTFFQPPEIDYAQFYHAMKEIDVEFAKLKEILEK